MRPELRRVGNSKSPVVVIDDFSGDAEGVAGLADALAPFPHVGERSYYPGLRRLITEKDGDANAYVDRTCQQAAQFIAGAFDVTGFSLLEASFSMVTDRPTDLQPPQLFPHFDSTDQKYYALLHYLRVPPKSGTAFFRQRSTGIERVTDANVDNFVRTAKSEVRRLPSNPGYIDGSNAFFQQIGEVEAIADRLVIYQGSLLHCGIIPKDMNFSSDPREGRLTANIFVRGQ